MNPDFSGIWKANLGRSKLLGPVPKAVLVKIAHSEPGLRAEMLIAKMDGSEERRPFRCLTTGEETIGQLSGVPLRTRSRWVGRELQIEPWLNSGSREMHFRDYWSLSQGGNTLTMGHRYDDLAGRMSLLERAPEEPS